MSVDRPLTNARGHIAWMIALVASTALIFQLERLERAFCTDVFLPEAAAQQLP